ncbi:hypothetical protein [Lacinutrix undariae]
MSLHKILKIVAALLGLAGVIFLVRVLSVGDEAIKGGDNGSVDAIVYLARYMLYATVAIVAVFVIKNLFTNTSGLKNTLIGIGAFAAVLVISYALSSGADGQTYTYNGQIATEGESHLVGAGLMAFYVLMVVAAGALLLSGVKKMIK